MAALLPLLFSVAPLPVCAQPSTAPTTQTAPAADWPMFRGNPQLTGVAGSALPLKLELRWKFAAPEAIESTAAIVEDAVYVGCDDGFLYCLRLGDGTVRWKYQAGEAVRSSPAVIGDGVYFGDDGGVFHAVDRTSGQVRWTFKTEGEIISSANHAAGRLLFGSYDGHLYCLNAGDGSLIWKRETEDRVHGTPGLAGDKVLIAGCDGHLRIMRVSDGEPAGDVLLGAYTGASAVVFGSKVFVGTFDNTVLGVDFAARRIAWTYQHPERQFPFLSSVAVVEGLVLIGGRDKMLHALDAENGRARWTFMTKGRIDSSPVVVQDRVFFGSADGVLYALDLKTGAERWRFETGAGIFASPAVGRGCLVIGADDGTVYCFGSKSAASP